jgi:cyclase
MRTFVIVLVLSMAATLAFAQQDFSKVEIKAEKVSGNIYMLTGAGGNIGVSAGDDGIVIVDDQFAPLADKIRAALKGITDKPVRFVINTHWHGDHTGGNPQFGETSTIIAQTNVRKRLAEGMAGAPPIPATPPMVKAGLPVITFDHDVTVHVNGEDIQAIHFPSGHTDGDSVIFFPNSHVVHMGDDFVTYGFPFIDLRSGGSAKGMIAACEKIMATLPADTKVIPGHGPLSTVADLKPFVQMLRETSAIVQKGIDQHKTLEQLQKENVLAAYSEKWSPKGAFIDTNKMIETLYNDLSGKKQGDFVRHN